LHLQAQPLRCVPDYNKVWITAGVQNQAHRLAIDLRVDPEPVVASNGLDPEAENHYDKD
jgi:hypothetical protein